MEEEIYELAILSHERDYRSVKQLLSKVIDSPICNPENVVFGDVEGVWKRRLAYDSTGVCQKQLVLSLMVVRLEKLKGSYVLFPHVG